VTPVSTSTPDPTAIDLTALGIEPFNARSVILSALLGSHPPELPARALVALAEQFSIRAGTIRTSLSRMVEAGDLVADDGRYRLTGRLVARQREQDEGQRAPDTPWDGSWITAIVHSDRRTVAERRAFRSSMLGSRMAELRPDIWLRPANTAGPLRSADVILTRGPLDYDDVPGLVARLWPLAEIDAQAIRIANALTQHRPLIDDEHDDALATTFAISAAAVRFLRVEPQLPVELAPSEWTPPTIRPMYNEFATAFQRQLHTFFRSVR
jgi:phenylacetic acid degradation operon negative regulatory protein